MESIDLTSTKIIEKNLARFEFELCLAITQEKIIFVYDEQDMIGSIGGSLGMFIGFSFFGFISWCIDLCHDQFKNKVWC